MPGMPAPPPPSSSQPRRSYGEQLGMGETLRSATIISFPALFPVNLSCQKENKKNPLNGQFPRGKRGETKRECLKCARHGGKGADTGTLEQVRVHCSEIIWKELPFYPHLYLYNQLVFMWKTPPEAFSVSSSLLSGDGKISGVFLNINRQTEGLGGGSPQRHISSGGCGTRREERGIRLPDKTPIVSPESAGG